ncbi:MAG: hypothetical protein HWE27_03905 [Gammaproteobacteria bacterium]|nr:hypothetical protein [Gammaproteobacteria bacterium]
MEQADTYLRPKSHLLVYIFGYLTGVILVPIFSLGMVRVESLSGKANVSETGWVEPPKRTEINSKVGIIFGLVFWMIIAISWAFAA